MFTTIRNTISAAMTRLTRTSDGSAQRGRFEAAKTNRLNKAHWEPTTDDPINQVIRGDQDLLRARCIHEAANNGFVAGVINTYCDGLIGDPGPVLQVQSENKAYVQKLETVWREWWQDCDVTGQYTGAELLRMCVGLFWTHGENVLQIVNDEQARGEIKVRINSIRPHRLRTPLGKTRGEGGNQITLGVERTKVGRPLAYHIQKEEDSDLSPIFAVEFDRIPARDIVHLFLRDEPGQARGIPWLATGLQAAADMRDYDDTVLDAARSAADQGVALWTDNPKAGFVNVNATEKIERRTLQTMPPGWKVEQLKPEQPTTNYVEFRAERQREIGRKVGMPLMMIRLDSSGHNYSSARFDAQIYWRMIGTVRKWLEQALLARLLAVVQREAELLRLLPEAPKDIKISWIWPPAPHVDPQKEATAQQIRLESGLTTHIDEWAATGKDIDKIVADTQLVEQRFKAAGLPTPWERAAQMRGAAKEAKKDDEDEKPAKPGKRDGWDDAPNPHNRTADAIHLHRNGSTTHVS